MAGVFRPNGINVPGVNIIALINIIVEGYIRFGDIIYTPEPVPLIPRFNERAQCVTSILFTLAFFSTNLCMFKIGLVKLF